MKVLKFFFALVFLASISIGTLKAQAPLPNFAASITAQYGLNLNLSWSTPSGYNGIYYVTVNKVNSITGDVTILYDAPFPSTIFTLPISCEYNVHYEIEVGSTPPLGLLYYSYTSIFNPYECEAPIERN